MLKKLTPLIVLAIFALGAYFMMKGMDQAVDMTQSKKEIKK
jgi:ABC-type dipeptide/oligopeptide/nickel transport system permease subunit